MLHTIIKRFVSKPRTLFLPDGAGAFLTAFILGVMVRTYREYFGMPAEIPGYLSVIAATFCLYSVACFFLVKNKWKPFLVIICIANVLYCFLTLSLVICYYTDVTALGLAYFLAEIVVISVVVFVELRTLTYRDR